MKVQQAVGYFPSATTISYNPPASVYGPPTLAYNPRESSQHTSNYAHDEGIALRHSILSI